MFFHLLTLLLASTAEAQRGQFTKNFVSTNPSAVCTDGSRAVFYSAVNEADPAAPWLIWLDGPANPIYTTDYQAYNTDDLPSTAPFTYGPFSEASSAFASYSAAVLMYCSYDYYLGNRETTVGGNTVYYKGHEILRAFLQQIQPQLAGATKIVVGGATSGAIAAVSNIDVFQSVIGGGKDISLLLDSPFFTPPVVASANIVAITDSSPSPACALNSTRIVYADTTMSSSLVPCCLDYLCASSLLPEDMHVMLLQSLAYSSSVNDALLVSSQQTGSYSASQIYNLSLTSTWDGALVSTALRQAANDRSKTAYIAYSCIAGPVMSPFGNSRCLLSNFEDRTYIYKTIDNLTVTADLGCQDAVQTVSMTLGDFKSDWFNSPTTWSSVSVSNFVTDPRTGAATLTSIEHLVEIWNTGIVIRTEEKCQGMNCNPTCDITIIYLHVTPYKHISSLAGLFLLCTVLMVIAGLSIAYCRPGPPKIDPDGLINPLANSSALSQAMANSRSLEAKGLTYWNAGPTVAPSLKHVSFAILQGSLVGIIGGSGCGKSTLLELLSGRRDSGAWCGEIEVCGKSVSCEWLAKNTGIVRQSLSPLVDQLTLIQNLEYAAMLRVRGSIEFIRERIAFVLERLELAEFKNSVTGTLSGGQRKRAEVALELLTQPDILFLDEPTSALDARTALNFMDWLAKVAQQTGSTIILSIHQPREEIWYLFSQIILLEKGFLVYSGAPFQLREDGNAVNPADLAVELAGNRRTAMIEASDRWCETTLDHENEANASVTQQVKCWLIKKNTASRPTTTKDKLTMKRGKTKLVEETRSEEDISSSMKMSTYSSTPSLICQIRSFLLRLMAVHPPFKCTTMRSAVGLSLLSVFVALLLGIVFWSMDSDSVRTKALAFLVLVPAFLSNSFVVSYICEDIPIYFIERSNYYVTPIGFFIHHILHLSIYIILPFTVFPLVQYFLLWGRVLNEFDYAMFVQMVGFSQICFVAFLSLFVFSCFLLKGKTSNAMIMNSSLESFFALFSGFLAPLPSLTLAPVRWLSYMSPALWGYVGVAYSIANRQFPGDCGLGTTATETTCFISQSGNAMIYGLGFEDLDPFIAWIILVSWSVLFFFLSWLVLARPWHKGAVKLVPAQSDEAQNALTALGEIAVKEQEVFGQAVDDYKKGTLSPTRRKSNLSQELTGGTSFSA